MILCSVCVFFMLSSLGLILRELKMKNDNLRHKNLPPVVVDYKNFIIHTLIVLNAAFTTCYYGQLTGKAIIKA